MAGSEWRIRVRLCGRVLLLFIQQRNSHDKFAAFSRGAEGLNFSAVQFRKSLHKSEPETQPSLGTIERPIGLREQVKDIRKQCGRDADTGISHTDDDPRSGE